MEALIKSLISLQNCDLQTRDIQEEKNRGPEKLKTLEMELQNTLKQMDEELSQVAETQREKRQLDQDIADLESRIQKSEIKQTSIKSNKEYTAVLKEIEDLQKEKGTLEERVIIIMEQADAMETTRKEIEIKKENLQKNFDEYQEKIQKQMAQLEVKIREYEAERAGITRDLDGEVLKKYDFIRERKEGIGLSSVVKGICQSCYMGIPPQKFNELMRGDKLMNCPHCNRFIYWGDDARFKSETDKAENEDSEKVEE